MTTSSKTEKKKSDHSDVRDIDHNLARVANQLQKQNSLGWSFARGVMTGLGASIGVTLVLTIVVFAISRIAGWLGIETLVQPVVETLQ